MAWRGDFKRLILSTSASGILMPPLTGCLFGTRFDLHIYYNYHFVKENLFFDNLINVNLLQTTFKTPKGEDPVVLDLWGLGKGTAWVNGHDIGRYWPSFLAGDNGCVSSCDYRGAYTGSKCLTNCGKSSQRWYVRFPSTF